MSALLSSGQVAGGDRIFLLDGYHGPIRIKDLKYSSLVLVAPLPGSTAHIESLLIDNSGNLAFKDLKVWATSANASNGALIRSYPNTQDLVFSNLDVRSTATAPTYLNWTSTNWYNNKRPGFLIDGNRVTLQGNRMTAVQHGMVVLAQNALIENNIVDGFIGDGMRALGDNSIVRGNQIQNCVSIDATHHDGFQSYSRGTGGKPGTGTLKNLVVENNRIFETTGGRTTMTCKLQGIGMFDGMFDGLRIENNTVVVSAYHGITVSGALNTIIRHNTVVHSNGLGGKSPWVKVGSHKNGTPSQNVQIVNNFGTNFTSTTDTAKNILVANNVRAGAASAEFVDFAGLNLALKKASVATDKGDPTRSNAADILGVKRFKGVAPDVGSFESN